MCQRADPSAAVTVNCSRDIKLFWEPLTLSPLVWFCAVKETCSAAVGSQKGLCWHCKEILLVKWLRNDKPIGFLYHTLKWWLLLQYRRLLYHMGSFQLILRRRILSLLNCMFCWNEDQSEFDPLALKTLSITVLLLWQSTWPRRQLIRESV